MKVLKIIGIVVVLLVVGVFAIGSQLSGDYRVERSIEIAAPPERVFSELNSLKKWTAWSPWVARDKSMKSTYSGPDEGVGASVSWTSDTSGDGTQTITESVPSSRIDTRLDFGSRGNATADFALEPTDSGTRVTWGMQGTMPGPLGGFLATRMDKWIGGDYEEGLKRLKAHVEAMPPPAAAPEAEAEPEAETADAGTADEGEAPAAQAEGEAPPE